MATNSLEQPTGAENVAWDLSDLYSAIDAGTFVDDMQHLEADAKAFEQKWRGRIGSCSSEELAQLLEEAQLQLKAMLGMNWGVQLEFFTDQSNPKIAASLQAVNEFVSMMTKYTIFVDIELQALSDEQFNAHCSSPELKSLRHFLAKKRMFKEHILSEAEEILDGEKDLVCASAWQRFFEQMRAVKEYDFDGRKVSEHELSKNFSSPDRSRRKAAAEALSAGLAESAPMNAFVFNTILSDWMIEDRMRNYPNWLSSMNIRNEISDAAVRALVDAVVKRYDISHRYYALKKRLLGLDDFSDYDRNAPVSTDSTRVSWSEARSIVSEAYHLFDSRIGEIADEFFEKNWIDAALRPAKQSGAFTASTTVHPYVMLNYTGTKSDVTILAHELGHGIHACLAQPRGLYNLHTPLTIAETASVFGEMLVFDSLMNKAESDEQKLALLMDKLHDICSTVFRQTSLNRFEDAIHTARKEKGELSVEQFNELWSQCEAECYGDAVRLHAGNAVRWSGISHFIHTPGYVYAYAFGELLVLALYELYKEGAPNFKQNYIDLLSAGGSDSPQNLLKPFDINLDDPSFWSNGLHFIDSLVSQAEEIMDRRKEN